MTALYKIQIGGYFLYSHLLPYAALCLVPLPLSSQDCRGLENKTKCWLVLTHHHFPSAVPHFSLSFLSNSNIQIVHTFEQRPTGQWARKEGGESSCLIPESYPKRPLMQLVWPSIIVRSNITSSQAANRLVNCHFQVCDQSMASWKMVA